MVHGWSADGDFFAPQKDLARRGLRVLAPDLPGHGPRAEPDSSLTIAALAVALRAWLIETGLERPLVLGWSMGASVLLDMLGRDDAPEVAGLVILDMTPKVANAPDWRLGLSSGHDRAGMAAMAEAMERDWPRVAHRIARALFARDLAIDPERLAFAETRMAARDGATMAALWRSLAVFDGRATLDRLAVPCLAVTGGRSRIYGPALLDWYRRHPSVTRAVAIADAGHAPQLERPDRLAEILEAFAGEIGLRRGS
jgi:pimeloyl-ACP methyl ester carboxylesterase